MSLISLLLLALLALEGFCAEERRSDVRAVLGAETEPGFWPTRGRRGGSSSEELPPPFWAHRGREIQAPCGPQPSSSSSSPPSHLYAQEPRYLLIQRRDVSADQPFWVSRGRKRAEE